MLLPKVIKDADGLTPEEFYKALGISVTKADSFYGEAYEAKLPEGWVIERTGIYWSNILDENGRTRACFFEKGAPWDRDFFIHPKQRFAQTVIRADDAFDQIVIKDGGKDVIYTSKLFPVVGCYEMYIEERNKARAWLDEHYPNHKDWKAYWEVA